MKPKESRVNLRVPEDLRERLEALIPKARKFPECALLGEIDLSKVARVALLRGVKVLEEEARRGEGGRDR